MERCKIDKETLCRYTGYKDKNDKKIFENDICMYNGSPVTIKYGKYYNRDCDCDITGWYYIGDMSKGYTQEFRLESSNIEVINNVHNKDKLRVGNKVYIFNIYLPDGSVEIAEAEVRQLWDNGVVYARTIDNKKGWILYQSYLNRVVFRTREEAERVLKEEENE